MGQPIPGCPGVGPSGSRLGGRGSGPGRSGLRRSGFWHLERGQATVELALALPVVVLTLLLIVQVAVVARAQVLVVNASREGARAAAVGIDPVAAARSTPGLDPSRMSVRISGGGVSGAPVTVEVSYRAPTDMAVVGPLLGEPTLSARVTMRVEGPR